MSLAKNLELCRLKQNEKVTCTHNLFLASWKLQIWLHFNLKKFTKNWILKSSVHNQNFKFRGIFWQCQHRIKKRIYTKKNTQHLGDQERMVPKELWNITQVLIFQIVWDMQINYSTLLIFLFFIHSRSSLLLLLSFDILWVKVLTGKLKTTRKGNRRRTSNLSVTVSSSLMMSFGYIHLLGFQSMLLLKAKPEISTWNLLWLLPFLFVCHPITFLPLHTGPCRITLFLLWASIATGQVPNLLYTQIALSRKRINRQ